MKISTHQFSALISSMEASATLALTQRVRELKAKGKDVIGLTIGEPDFTTPDYIREAAKQALDDGFTHYPPVAGLPALREAIATKLKRENNLNYSPQQIMVSTGAKQSLYNVVLSILNPGDEAILPTPFWVSYHAMVHLAAAKSIFIPTDIDAAFKITPEQLEAAITPKSRLLFMTTPSNPSGSMYSKEELTALVEVLEKHPQIYIISDEIYEHIAFDREHLSLASFEHIYDRVITVNGFSKGYAMTGWRLGYIAASEAIIQLAAKLQGQCTSGANTFAQKGAIAALEGGLQSCYAMRDAFKKRRDVLYQRLNNIQGLQTLLPDGAFYFYPDFSHFFGMHTPSGQQIKDIDDLCMYLIDDANLAIVTGKAFGTPKNARLSYAYAREILDKALDRLEEGLALLV